MTTNKKKCFANQHMTLEQYGFWEHARYLSKKSGQLYFDGRKFAARFKGVTKNTPYRVLAEMIKAGWIVAVGEEGKRRKTVRRGGGPRSETTGQFAKSIYKVLSHDEWTAKHGCKECIDHSRNQEPTIPVSCSPPFPKTGRKLNGNQTELPQTDKSLFKGSLAQEVKESNKTSSQGGSHKVHTVPENGNGDEMAAKDAEWERVTGRKVRREAR